MIFVLAGLIGKAVAELELCPKGSRLTCLAGGVGRYRCSPSLRFRFLSGRDLAICPQRERIDGGPFSFVADIVTLLMARPRGSRVLMYSSTYIRSRIRRRFS